MYTKSNRQQPDKIILFETGIIIALIFVNNMMNVAYQGPVVPETQKTDIFDEIPFSYHNTEIEKNIKTKVDEVPKIEKAEFFDPSTIIVPISDFFKLLETTITPPSTPIIGQIKPISVAHAPDTSTIIDVWAQEMPSFPGGEEALIKYVVEKFNIPDVVSDMDLEVEVVVQFVVDKTGDVVNIKILKCSHPNLGIEKEAKRVYANLPIWTPGKNSGKAVSVKLTQPIKIKTYN